MFIVSHVWLLKVQNFNQILIKITTTRKQPAPAHLRQGHVVREVAASSSVVSGFPYAALKAMVTKISKSSRIQDSFWITPKIEPLVVFAIPREFQKDPSITF